MQYGPISALGRNDLFLRFLRCASGFWQGPSAAGSWALVASLITLVLLALLTQIGLNIWTRDFFNALERKDGTAIFQHW